MTQLALDCLPPVPHGLLPWLSTPFIQIKATSNALKTNVLIVKGGEHLLLLAGFKPMVREEFRRGMFVWEMGVNGGKYKRREAARIMGDEGIAAAHRAAYVLGFYGLNAPAASSSAAMSAL